MMFLFRGTPGVSATAPRPLPGDSGRRRRRAIGEAEAKAKAEEIAGAALPAEAANPREVAAKLNLAAMEQAAEAFKFANALKPTDLAKDLVAQLEDHHTKLNARSAQLQKIITDKRSEDPADYKDVCAEITELMGWYELRGGIARQMYQNLTGAKKAKGKAKAKVASSSEAGGE